jgi:RNA polymerase sigma-70 factor (ECF subfamily)
MDDASFQEEYARVSDGLYTYLVRMAGDSDLAADALQEAALKAYRARGTFRGDASFKTWIFRIAINTMKNMLAKAGRERRVMDRSDITDKPELASSGLTPEASLSRRQDAHRLTDALDMIEEKYRVAFLLKHVEGMSYREIGAVLDIGEGNARMRVYRARHALAHMLEKE